MSANVKRYILSSLITLIATFAAAVLPMVGDLDFSKGAVVALIMVGVRAVLKALFEGLSKLAAMPVKCECKGPNCPFCYAETNDNIQESV